ncbi:MAG: LON peptidase substrate-binding domain-containing protein [Flectobacillus sp.]|uniref:LON peptidase substrate-binding domain-containing protein n=1 Tax=Flectobacillus sp. TaxID=50419 RepID=UPI003B9A405C
MQKFLPLFPLNLVVFPLEDLNLHIFEPRYRQLIKDAVLHDSSFGIPAFIDGKMQGFGTEVKIVSVYKVYEDGRMDIKTQGVRVFRILDFQNPVEGKLYAGGDVETLKDPEIKPPVLPKLIEQIADLYTLLNEENKFNPQKPQPYSYQIAHKIGLSIEKEYELLKMPTETERQAYISAHLDKVLPVLHELERTKERIRMNGHFKNLDPLNF